MASEHDAINLAVQEEFTSADSPVSILPGKDEMVEHVKSDPLPAGFSNEHFQAMAEALRENRSTMDLPQSAFNIIYMGIENDTATLQRLGYRLQRGPFHTEVLFAQIHRYSTLPDSLPRMYAPSEAFAYMMDDFERHFENKGGYDWDLDGAHEVSIMDAYDQRLLDMVVNRVKRSSVR